jgi:hypothetical protein
VNSDGPIVDDVRRRRVEISSRFEDDLDRYFEHIRELQEQHPDRLVNQISIVRGQPRAAGESKTQ